MAFVRDISCSVCDRFAQLSVCTVSQFQALRNYLETLKTARPHLMAVLPRAVFIPDQYVDPGTTAGAATKTRIAGAVRVLEPKLVYSGISAVDKWATERRTPDVMWRSSTAVVGIATAVSHILNRKEFMPFDAALDISSWGLVDANGTAVTGVIEWVESSLTILESHNWAPMKMIPPVWGHLLCRQVGRDTAAFSKDDTLDSSVYSAVSTYYGLPLAVTTASHHLTFALALLTSVVELPRLVHSDFVAERKQAVVPEDRAIEMAYRWLSSIVSLDATWWASLTSPTVGFLTDETILDQYVTLLHHLKNKKAVLLNVRNTHARLLTLTRDQAFIHDLYSGAPLRSTMHQVAGMSFPLDADLPHHLESPEQCTPVVILPQETVFKDGKIDENVKAEIELYSNGAFSSVADPSSDAEKIVGWNSKEFVANTYSSTGHINLFSEIVPPATDRLFSLPGMAEIVAPMKHLSYAQPGGGGRYVPSHRGAESPVIVTTFANDAKIKNPLALALMPFAYRINSTSLRTFSTVLPQEKTLRLAVPIDVSSRGKMQRGALDAWRIRPFREYTGEDVSSEDRVMPVVNNFFDLMWQLSVIGSVDQGALAWGVWTLEQLESRILDTGAIVVGDVSNDLPAQLRDSSSEVDITTLGGYWNEDGSAVLNPEDGVTTEKIVLEDFTSNGKYFGSGSYAVLVGVLTAYRPAELKALGASPDATALWTLACRVMPAFRYIVWKKGSGTSATIVPSSHNAKFANSVLIRSERNRAQRKLATTRARVGVIESIDYSVVDTAAGPLGGKLIMVVNDSSCKMWIFVDPTLVVLSREQAGEPFGSQDIDFTVIDLKSLYHGVVVNFSHAHLRVTSAVGDDLSYERTYHVPRPSTNHTKLLVDWALDLAARREPNYAIKSVPLVVEGEAPQTTETGVRASTT